MILNGAVARGTPIAVPSHRTNSALESRGVHSLGLCIARTEPPLLKKMLETRPLSLSKLKGEPTMLKARGRPKHQATRLPKTKSALKLFRRTF